MTVDNLTIIQIEDTIIHKQYVLASALKMFKYLCTINKSDLGLELLKRASIHDNSKLEDDELYLLSRLKDRKEAFTEAEYTPDEMTRMSIEEHWKRNRHHPEFFKDPSEMTELDILEMICDWHARSVQYGTDLLEFVRVRQKNRFHFNKKMYNDILNYCKILLKEEEH